MWRPSRPALALGAALASLSACGLTPLDVVDLPATSVGLIAYWNFNEGSGTSVLDHSGNTLDGQLTGGAWIADGSFGGALRLIRGDYVTVPNFPDATPDWTVSAWVRYAQSDIGSDLATIIGNEIPSTGGWEMQGPVNAETSKLEFSYSNAGGHYYTLICCEIQPDQWMHFTAVVDSQALTMTLYLGASVQILEQVQAPILAGNRSLHIGVEEKPNQLAGPFQGAVDEIRIYGRALNAAEITRLDTGP